MSKSATVFARVEPNIKEQSEAILNNLGLSMSNAIDMYLRQIVMSLSDVSTSEPFPFIFR